MKYLFIMIVFLQSCMAEKPIKITQFFTNNKPIDTLISNGEEKLYYNNLFLISNYSDNNNIAVKLDSFVVSFILNNLYSPNTNEIVKKMNLVININNQITIRSYNCK